MKIKESIKNYFYRGGLWFDKSKNVGVSIVIVMIYMIMFDVVDTSKTIHFIHVFGFLMMIYFAIKMIICSLFFDSAKHKLLPEKNNVQKKI
jgi:hypothetical protein